MKKFCMFLCALVACLSLIGCAPEEKGEIKVYVPDGAPALAVSYMMENVKELDNRDVKYVVSTPDVVKTALSSGEADLAVLPTNVAAALHKSGAKVKLAAAVTMGNLYVVGKTSATFADLSGKVIACIGQGAVPALVFKKILTENGLTVREGADAAEGAVTLNYVQDGAAAIGLLKTGKVFAALLGEPAATNAQSKVEGATELFDIQAEWGKIYGGDGYPQASLMANCDKKTAELFVAEMKKGENWAAKNPEKAIAAVKANMREGEESTLPAALTGNVISRCKLTCRPAAEIKQQYSDLFAALNVTVSDEIYL